MSDTKKDTGVNGVDNKHTPGSSIVFTKGDDPKIDHVTDQSSLVDESEEPSDDTESKIEDKKNEPASEVETADHKEAKRNHDSNLTSAFSPVRSKWRRIKHWLRVPMNQKIVTTIVAILLTTALVVPQTRFGILNAMGIKAPASFTIVDLETGQPLRSVDVTIGDKTVKTDRTGTANFSNLRLGDVELLVEKLAYATFRQKITIRSGSNLYSSIGLKPVGVKYSFEISDWLSGNPIAGADVSSGSNVVLSDEAGLAVLSLPPTNDETVEVTLTTAGYKSQKVTVKTDSTAVQKVKLVLGAEHYFVSRRSGKYDLYKVNLDGTGEQLVLKASGKESSDIQVATDNNSGTVYMVSTREGNRNSNGVLLYGLFTIDFDSGEVVKVDESPTIKIYGIVGKKLIYVKEAEGAKENDPNKQLLMSLGKTMTTELASTNYFNSVIITHDKVFYATSDYYKSDRTPYLYKIDPFSGAKEVVFSGEIWTVFRTGLNQLTFDVKQDWYQLDTASTDLAVQLEGRPTEVSSRLYEYSPGSGYAVWVDQRDGKDYLIVTDATTNEDKTVHIQSGLRHPVHWVDDTHIVFRVVTEQETADYIVSLNGGDAQKISDVSDVNSYNRWYYSY